MTPPMKWGRDLVQINLETFIVDLFDSEILE